MIRCTCMIVGVTPYSQSAAIQSVRGQNEPHDEFEKRTWREHIHRDADGEAFIPPTALKNCLSEIAKYLSESIPGKGKATYTKNFEAGVTVLDPLMLGVKADDVPSERLFLPSDGKRGSGKRIWKTYPIFHSWKANAEIIVLDPIITPDVLHRYLIAAGKYIGLGRFRPRQNGYYGRFDVQNFLARAETLAA